MSPDDAPPVDDGSDPRESVRTRVLVIGGGIMGSGIAAQAALAGFPVTVVDVSEELARKGATQAARALEHAERKGALPEGAREAAVARIDAGIGLRRADGAQIVVEAATERLDLKRQIFREVESIAPPTALLASNTSSLPITSIAEALADPGRLVGIHFFNPVLQMDLVEIIPGFTTRPDITERAHDFARRLGKTVVASRDSPGFVTTRALAVLVNEAAWMLYEGVATKEDIDAAYRLGFHHPMGPFQLVDLVGIDTAVAILDVLWDGFRDSKYRVCPLLRQMVSARQLGRKSGRGFYDYPGTRP